ncbi:hypothetical protein GECvBMG_gp079c [Salmonella phage GEC_vB_MG]|nr:hypothetical protein GECvBMG_gp079c [Salmonella phage GEC_vB_MG]
MTRPLFRDKGFIFIKFRGKLPPIGQITPLIWRSFE